jgi:hypothetical protein
MREWDMRKSGKRRDEREGRIEAVSFEARVSHLKP